MGVLRQVTLRYAPHNCPRPDLTDTAPTVLLTRPKAQSVRFAQELGDANVMISPVIEIRERDLTVDPREFDLLVFSSENGIRSAAARCDLRGMRGYAVGGRTAEVGTEYGMELIATGGTADDLVARILRDRPKGRILHLRGRHSRGRIEERLNADGLETESVIAYDQVPQPLTPEAAQVLAGAAPVILPVFSPRTAALLAPMIEHAKSPLVLIGMSRAVLDAWTGPEPIRMTALSVPSGKAMIAEIRRHIGGLA